MSCNSSGGPRDIIKRRFGESAEPQVKVTSITESIPGSNLLSLFSVEHSTTEPSKITLILPPAFTRPQGTSVFSSILHPNAENWGSERASHLVRLGSEPLNPSCVAEACKPQSPWTNWKATRSKWQTYKTGKTTCKRHLVTRNHRRTDSSQGCASYH